MYDDVIWHTPQEAKAENNRSALIAMGLVMWANCMAKNTPPAYFGETMVIIGEKLGVSPVPDEIKRLADEWQAEHERHS